MLQHNLPRKRRRRQHTSPGSVADPENAIVSPTFHAVPTAGVSIDAVGWLLLRWTHPSSAIAPPPFS